MADSESFVMLLEKVDEYGVRLGIGKEVILRLYREASDWAFIIQVDALHETACRDLLARLLTLKNIGDACNDAMPRFVDALGFQGRSSIIGLLKVAGCPLDSIKLVESVRKVRNPFAHDIMAVERSLREVIEARNDRSDLLKVFSCITDENYDEAEYVKALDKDPELLRFGILHQTMVLLLLLHGQYPAEN